MAWDSVAEARSSHSASISPQQSPWCSESMDLKGETQVMFVQCFKDDILQNRHLLMSQINNLYKMRNNGNALQYKLAGYEKLHDFLMDMPGLALFGSGNRMEVKLIDAEGFANFCDDITADRDMPS